MLLIEQTRRKVNIYFKHGTTGKLSKIVSGPVFDHIDAILAVQDALIESKEGWKGPVLAVIEGGKK